MTTQQNSQVIRADADGDVVYPASEGICFIKGWEWSGVDKAPGDQLILTDGSGNEVWVPTVGTSGETHERIFSNPLPLNGVILQSIPTGTFLLYKE